MATRIVMPRLGDFMTEGTVVRLAKAQGDNVGQGEVIAEIETEKLNYDLEATEGGVFHPIVDEGATVAVDGLIGYLLAEGEAVPEPPQAQTPSSAGSRAAATDPEALEGLGISVVLSVVAGRDEGALRASVASSPSVKVHRVWCVADAPEERHRMLAVWREVTSAIAIARADGQRVLVHCAAGMSRSASAVIAWIAAPRSAGGLGVGLGEALRWVRAARPIASPNDGFLTGLAAWASAARRGELCLADEVSDADAAAEAQASLEEDRASREGAVPTECPATGRSPVQG